jgi:hypothetical protein
VAQIITSDAILHELVRRVHLGELDLAFVFTTRHNMVQQTSKGDFFSRLHIFVGAVNLPYMNWKYDVMENVWRVAPLLRRERVCLAISKESTADLKNVKVDWPSQKRPFMRLDTRDAR